MKRDNLLVFIYSRALCIYPGLIVAVLFCVVVIGALVTTEPITDYFSSAATWSYLKNNSLILKGVQFDLPQVFVNNPYPISVNGSLWTLPIELWMYFLVAITGSFSLLKRNKRFNAIFFVVCLIYVQSLSSSVIAIDPRNAQLGLLFLLGGFFYINRNKIPLGFLGVVLLSSIAYLIMDCHFSGLVKAFYFAS